MRSLKGEVIPDAEFVDDEGEPVQVVFEKPRDARLAELELADDDLCLACGGVCACG